jgi:type IV pilus assembly protein PilC
MEIKKIPIPPATRKQKEEDVMSKITDFLQKDIQLGRPKMQDKIKLYFYHELSMLLSAGLDLKKSLETIVDEQNKEKTKLVFERILTNVIHGMSLSSALEKEEYFSPHEYYTIQIGEETGRLSEVLHQLYVYYDKKIKQRRQVIGALSYPLIVLGVAILAVVFFMTFLIPMFMDIFSRFNAELPALTQFVVYVSSFLRSYTIYIVLAIFGIVILFIANKNNQKFQLQLATFFLKIPYCNSLIQLIQISRFSQILALLLSSNTPLSRALHLSKQMTTFYYFHTILEQVERDVLQGDSLYAAMSKHSFFPKRMIYLIKTGEEVNKLDAIFLQLHDQYSNELEHKTGIMGTILEPLLIIFVGVLVAVILISMYLPMFKLGTTIY